MRLFFLPNLLVALSAAAQPVAPDTTLPEVTVTAARLALAPREAPARVTVLTAEAFAAAGAATVADVLERRAPLFVRRYGPGGLATVSLRGAGSAQTLVLLDGARLADPQLGPPDLALLPTVLLDAAEVLHGAGSALHGTDALGGVLHLRTLAAGTAGWRLETEAGAWGHRRLSGVASGQAGPLALVAAAEGLRTDGDFLFRDRSLIGEPLVRREGIDQRRASAFAAAGYARGPLDLRASLLLADAERGLGGTDSVGARQWDRLARTWLDARHTARWGGVEVRAAVHRGRLRYASPYPPTRPDALDETSHTTTATLDLQTTLTTLPGWHLTGAAWVGLAHAEHPSLSEEAADRHAALALSAARTTGRLRLFPALRLDRYAPAGAARRLALSPLLGANLHLRESLHLKASAGRAFRMPTLNDRFWQPGGNAALRPERGWTVDLGLAWSSASLRAEVSAFAARARDQIVWRPTPAGYWAPENLVRTRTLGLEATAEATLPLGPRRALDAGFAAALTDARDRSDPSAPAYGQPLRYVPRWTLSAWTGLALGGLRLDLHARAAARRFTTADASQSLPPYLILDGQARYTRAVGGVRATLGVVFENLTGLQYEVIPSYVMPPRHLRVRLLLQSR
ncbi:MAG TPA: TonB-dependent receptor [Rubricoccaceae bacterium]|nr:TonB-dependent receptor [Rubricoccaceae bacterium]